MNREGCVAERSEATNANGEARPVSSDGECLLCIGHATFASS